jgi:hypothetical protein
MTHFLLTRRELVGLLGAGAAATLLPVACTSEAPPEVEASFFSEAERRALGALADRFLPPDDLPGGAALGAVEYIESLLTAFDSDPPRIFAGGPFSGRRPFADADGAPKTRSPIDEFARFLPLTRAQDAAWRLRLYGSAGVPGGGPNDHVLPPVVGLRDVIRGGLVTAMESAPGPLEGLTKIEMGSVVRDLDASFRDTMQRLVIEAALAAPEYGGNRRLAGWRMIHHPGDSLPLGYTFFDATTGTNRERPEAPVSTADPGPDPEPLRDDIRQFLEEIVALTGGRKFR